MHIASRCPSLDSANIDDAPAELFQDSGHSVLGVIAIAGNEHIGRPTGKLGLDMNALPTVLNALTTWATRSMFRPEFPGGPPDMFIAGNSDDAKNRVSAIVNEFGWGIVDVGGIECSRYLEAMCMVWVPLRDAREQLESSVQAAEEVTSGCRADGRGDSHERA